MDAKSHIPEIIRGILPVILRANISERIIELNFQIVGKNVDRLRFLMLNTSPIEIKDINTKL